MTRAADVLSALALVVVAGLFSEVSGRPALAAGTGVALLLVALIPSRLRLRGPAALRVGVGLALAGAGIATAVSGGPDPSTGYMPVGGPLAAAVLIALWVGAWRFLLHRPWGGRAGTLALGLIALMALGAAPPWAGYSLGTLAFALLGLSAMRLGDPERPVGIHRDRRTLIVVAALLASSGGLAVGLSQALYPLNRWAVDQMSASWRDRSNARAGFSEQLALGSLNGMLNSDAVALRVRGEAPGHLRAMVYQRYKSGRWLPPVPAPPKTLRVDPLGRRTDPAVGELQVLANTGGRYPVTLGSTAVAAPNGEVLRDSMGVLRAPMSETPTRLAFRSGPQDDEVAGPRPPEEADLQVPDDVRTALTPEALRWVGQARGQAALAILAGVFQRDFEYSLKHRRSTRLDPAVDFVLHHRVGHCEYFASAMVLMARSLGIPARVVGGYMGGERSVVGAWHLVRQRNAHAWVEAWTGAGWRTYDPTPGSALAANLEPKAGFLPSLWHLLAAELGDRWDALTAQDFLLLALSLGAFLGLFLLIPRWWRERRARIAGAARAVEGPLPCYEDLETALARAGAPRASGETLSAFADRLHTQGFVEADVVRTYAALRYGGVGDQTAVIAEVQRAEVRLVSGIGPG